MRVLLVIVQIRQHTRAQLLEYRLAGHRRGVCRLEQPVALGLHHRGEERALVGEIVVHQRAGHARAFGDLVDPDLVVRAFAEHLGAQSQQLAPTILGGQPPPGFRHARHFS